MTPTICTTYTLPDILHGISPTTFDDLDKASRIFFYYRGGADVIALKKDSENLFTIYNPTFNSRVSNVINNEIRDDSEAISREMKETKTPGNTWFLYDMATKKIINGESFMDYMPYSGMRRALCIYEIAGERDEGKYRFLSDNSPYGVLQFIMKVVAKRELMPPTNTCWSTPGKKLLAYLVSRKYCVNNSFQYETGAWDSTVITGVFTPEDKRPVKLYSLITTRALELKTSITQSSSKLLSPPTPLEEDENDEDLWERWRYLDELPISTSKEGILLSEVIQVGVESFYNSAYTSSFSVEIDVMREIFKEIVIDPMEKVCMICLNTGVHISKERIMEDLQTDSIVMMTET